MSLTDDRRPWTFHRTRRAGVVCLSPVILCFIALAVIGVGTSYLSKASCPACPGCDLNGSQTFTQDTVTARLKLLESPPVQPKDVATANAAASASPNLPISEGDESPAESLSERETRDPSSPGETGVGDSSGKLATWSLGPPAEVSGDGENVELPDGNVAADVLTGEPAGQTEAVRQTAEVDTNGAQKDEAEEATDAEPPLPRIIAVTPTHPRAAQAFHMTQVVNILRVIPPPVLWVVVEAMKPTEETAKLLKKTAGRCLQVGIAKECTAIEYVHLATGLKPEDTHISRGVRQRNTALDYIQTNRVKGLVYFMDDDNAYSPEVFEELRKIKRVGVLPVGLMWSADYQKMVPWRQADPFVERALVRLNEKGEPQVYGWETFEWALKAKPGTGRKFNTDMAGFAFNSELLWEPTSNITGRPKHPVRFRPKSAWLETQFLERLIPKDTYLEPLADMCRDVWVWHVKFETQLYMPYPDNVWRVPQPNPKDLVQDSEPVKGISRYIRNGIRYKLRDYNSTMPFGYKVNPAPESEPPKVAKKKWSSKSKRTKATQ